MNKPKMSASYRAIFLLSILMVFVVLLLAAASGSKSAGIAMWYWGYTAWGMHKRNNEGLATFHKVFLWFDAVVFSIVGLILAFNSGAQYYIGYSFFGFLFVGAISTAISYGLMRYFQNQLILAEGQTEKSASASAPGVLGASRSENKPVQQVKIDAPNIKLAEHEMNALYAAALDDVERGNVDRGLWAKCFAATDGNESQAKARYIELRVADLSASAIEKKRALEIEQSLDSLIHRSDNGDVEALVELGLIKYNGLYNQQKHLVGAFDCLKRAAFLGSAKAQHMLSSMHWKGEGTDKNKVHAHAWAVVASSKVDDAKSNVEVFQREMTMDQIYESDNLVKTIKAALQKNLNEGFMPAGDSQSPISSKGNSAGELQIQNPKKEDDGRYWFIGFGILVVAFVGYNLYKEYAPQDSSFLSFSSKKVYDFYPRTVWDNCNSPYEEKPIMTMEFMYNNQSKEIIAKIDYEEKGVKKQDFTKLEPCSAFDEKNWSCGGNLMANGRDYFSKYVMSDGKFTYEESSYAKCAAKIVAR